MGGAPKNAATKFSDLKFHHTALDFNKAGGVVGPKSHMTGGKRGNNSIDISGKASHMGSAPKPHHGAANNRDFQNTTQFLPMGAHGSSPPQKFAKMS